MTVICPQRKGEKPKRKYKEGFTMMKNVTKKQAEALLEIAKKASYAIGERGDLEYRMSDSEDFLDISVGAIEAMLEQAFLLGRKSR